MDTSQIVTLICNTADDLQRLAPYVLLVLISVLLLLRMIMSGTAFAITVFGMTIVAMSIIRFGPIIAVLGVRQICASLGL